MYPHGTLMMIRKSIEEIGDFDPRYFAYMEEYDLGLRAILKGWKVGVVGDAYVANPSRTEISSIVYYLNIRNSILYVQKRSGYVAAFVRTLVILTNTLVLAVHSTRGQSKQFARIRFRAVLDFWKGRFGPPSPS